MNLLQAWHLIRKELMMGPRSSILLFVLVYPLILTVVVNVVFGSLFDSTPRLGVVDEDGSAVAVALEDVDGIRVRPFERAATMLERVESNDLDAGLVLQAGFDDAVTAGQRPLLQFYVGGESLASNRAILAVTTVDVVRDVAGDPLPLAVDVVTLGDTPSLPLESRLLPFIVVLTVMVAGTYLPAAGLIDEREKRTLHALLVTPTQMPDVLAAKGVVGFGLAIGLGVMTLVLNSAFGAQPVALLLALVVAAWMMVELGLMLGSWAKDVNTLFTAIKAGGFLIALPAVFYIWPDLPQWPARLVPTYYFADPIFQMAVNEAALVDVAGDLLLGTAICVALLPLVARSGRRLEAKLATEM